MRDYKKNLTSEQERWVSFSTATNAKGKTYTVASIDADFYKRHGAEKLKSLHDAGLNNDHVPNFKQNVLLGYFAEIAAFKVLKNRFQNLGPACVVESKYHDFRGREGDKTVFVEVKLCKNDRFVNLNIAKLRHYLDFAERAELGLNSFYLCSVTPYFNSSKPHYSLKTFCLDDKAIKKLKALPVKECTQPENPRRHDINSSGFVTLDLDDLRTSYDVSYL